MTRRGSPVSSDGHSRFRTLPLLTLQTTPPMQAPQMTFQNSSVPTQTKKKIQEQTKNDLWRQTPAGEGIVRTHSGGACRKIRSAANNDRSVRARGTCAVR